uniref:Uncharacterized protein n=1 Tax=Arundo donax TaxID=35708 RepID=A0A0A8YSF2_ARUDO
MINFMYTFIFSFTSSRSEFIHQAY